MALSGLIATDTDGTLVAFGSVSVIVDSSGGGSGGVSVFSQTTPATVESTGTATTIVAAGVGTASIAANTWSVGEVYRGTLQGIYGTRGTSAGFATVSLLFGATTVATWTITPSELQDEQPWKIAYDFVRLSTGSSGTIRGTAWLTYQEANSAAVTVGSGMNAPVVVASDSSQAIGTTVDWQNGDSGNTWTCYLNYTEPLGTSA